MTILFICGGLLLSGFIFHLIWWRKKLPHNPTSTLLKIFFGWPILIITLAYLISPSYFTLTLSDWFRLGLLYTGCSLVYIIIYSAIEQQSPTLAIIHYVWSHGKNGCTHESLIKHLNAGEEIKKRISVMEQGNWIFSSNDQWELTNKGQRVAFVFEKAALIFGIPTGG